MTTPTGKRRYLSQVETVKMAALLQQHITLIPKIKDEDPQLCKFEEGWNDERIAKEIAQDLGVNHSANLRENLYGRLFVKSPKSELEERVDFLEKKVEQLCTLLHEFIGKHDKVCIALGLNKVVDVRHLTMEDSFKETFGDVAQRGGR